MTGLTKSLSGGVPNSNSAEALIPVVAIIGERHEVYHNALTERNGRGELVPNLHKLKRPLATGAASVLHYRATVHYLWGCGKCLLVIRVNSIGLVRREAPPFFIPPCNGRVECATISAFSVMPKWEVRTP